MPERLRRDAQAHSNICRAVTDALAADGAETVSLPILQPAADLLPHYGEALRAHACVLMDGHGAELFLVPDYTVPVCRHHLDGGGGPGRFLYSGPVFRPPAPGGSESPTEEWQAGIEIYSEGPPSVDADTQLLNLTLEAVRIAKVEPGLLKIGDVTLGTEILAAVPMPEHQRERLRRRWAQPIRFNALLGRFAGTAPRPQSLERNSLLDEFVASTDAPAATVQQLLADRQLPVASLRTIDEIAQRLTELVAERNTEPLPTKYADQLQAILEISSPYQDALTQLTKCATAMAVDLSGATDRLASRVDSYVGAGIDPAILHLDMQLGGEMGYYDGMVFEVRAGDDDLLVASGGRYDGLPRALGADLCALGAAVWTQRLHELRAR